MGLLDRNKHKPQPPPGGASAANGASPPVAGDADALRDMLIAAASARDIKLVTSLATANRQQILSSFSHWQKAPEEIRANSAAMQRYGAALVMLAELFRDKLGDPSLLEKLQGSRPSAAPSPIDSLVAQWERGIAQSDELVQAGKFDEATAVLSRVMAGLASVPRDIPLPLHAVTEGRLAHAYFSQGQVAPALEHMTLALQLAEERRDDQGIVAGLRGLYEIGRYAGEKDRAAEFADRLAAQLGKMGLAADQHWWTKQAGIVRAGEPLCRVVFFVNEQQCEVDELPPLTEGRLRYGFVRNRPSLGQCEAMVQQAMAAGQQAKFEQAVGLLLQAARVDPFDPTPHYQAAVTLMHLEKPAEAVEEYDQTEKLAPGWFNCRGERWVASEIAAGRLEQPVFFILRTEEMPEQAMSWEQKLSLVDQATAKGLESAPLLLYRARCLMRLGRVSESLPILRRALEIAAEPDIKTRVLVDLQMVVSDTAEKRDLLQQAIALNGNLAAAAIARLTLKQMGS